jgi:hypothetical protein
VVETTNYEADAQLLTDNFKEFVKEPLLFWAQGLASISGEL